MFALDIAVIVLQAYVAMASSSPHIASRTEPTVTLDSAVVTGVTSGSVDSFLGIPFAAPPTGNLRFNLPQPISAYNTSFSATEMGPVCPQQPIELPYLSGLPAETADFITNTVYGFALTQSEDCLFINVIRPSVATSGSNLPVLVWIFGGAFEFGGTTIFDGSGIVERSIELDEPVIYVSMNYRVSGFGFLASQEVKDAGVGNIGLQDQREALRWVQKYIGNFGGDPTKVTIWGESSGAICVALQMVTNGGDTEGLFRAAFMQSGSPSSPVPVKSITDGQIYYDEIVSFTGCSNSNDTLDCLREVPYDTLVDAINQTPSASSYQSLNFAWLPRVDGIFLTDNPQVLVKNGQVAAIPIVNGKCIESLASGLFFTPFSILGLSIGGCDDEGTLFALSSLNVTTNAEFSTYIKSEYLVNISSADLAEALIQYPEDVTQGSPFDTGHLNAITPEFKRLAAFMGDVSFQGPRRSFLQSLSGKQPIWTYISKRFKMLPVLGSVHTTDFLNVYAGGDLADYLINFVVNLNPNGFTLLEWPEYTAGAPNMLQLNDGPIPLSLTLDNYRVNEINFAITLL